MAALFRLRARCPNLRLSAIIVFLGYSGALLRWQRRIRSELNVMQGREAEGYNDASMRAVLHDCMIPWMPKEEDAKS